MAELGHLRVLLVEDSEADAELVRARLEREGYALELERVDGEAGMRAALGRGWDVVVCDYSLPGFGAFEALELVRASGSDAPFVALSATIGEEAVVELLQAGARDCVLKSNLPRLAPVIERELAERDLRRRTREAEEALRESEERFRRLAENAPDIIYRFRLRPEPGFEYVSPAATAIVGYTPEEHYADPELGRKIVHPDDRPLLEEARRLPHPAVRVLRWIGKDGRALWIEQHSVPILDEDGEVVAREGIARDITDRKLAELRAAESEQRLLLALEQGRTAIFDQNLHAAEAVVTENMAALLGHEPPKTLDGFLELVHQDDRDALVREIDETVETGAPFRTREFRVVAADGTVRWFGGHASMLRDEAGEPARIVGVMVDISERKEAEETLLGANETLEAIFRSAPVAIVAIDREGVATSWNPAAERMFGWSEAEVLGRPLPHFPPEEAEARRALLERVLAGESLTDLEARRLRKDGTVVDVILTLTPLHDAAGEVTGVLGTLADVSERVRARRRLEESVELLRQVDGERRRLLARLVQAQEEERRRIASDIHDDSVQVLTALALRLELLRRRLDDPELLGMLEEVERTARSSLVRLRHLIFELRPPALDRDGLAAALRLYLEQMRQDRGIEFELTDGLEQEPAAETRVILYRIAQEALANVAKHAQARRVVVEVAGEEDGVWVRVEDDGRGLPEELAAGPEPGHLGLAAMRERAEMAGGWWRIAPAEGGGTAVEFFVPDEGRPGDEEVA